jgi:hypothetical protein
MKTELLLHLLVVSNPSGCWMVLYNNVHCCLGTYPIAVMLLEPKSCSPSVTMSLKPSKSTPLPPGTREGASAANSTAVAQPLLACICETGSCSTEAVQNFCYSSSLLPMCSWWDKICNLPAAALAININGQVLRTAVDATAY